MRNIIKSSIKKVLIIAGILIFPVFCCAATDTVICSASYPNDLVGKTVTFSATVIPDNPEVIDTYGFSWSGACSGSDSTCSNSFSSGGTQTANITATNITNPGNPTLNTSCSVNIYTDATLPSYLASCSPDVNSLVIGQPVLWTPTVNGPLGPYSITWLGDELNRTSQDPVTVIYTSSGDKSAVMASFKSRYGIETPTHNRRLFNVACTNTVNVVDESVHNPTPLTITGQCLPAPSRAHENDNITWRSNVSISGGASPYIITWTDSEGAMGTGDSVTKTYSSEGTKNAYLTVQDNAGQLARVDCADLFIQPKPSGGAGMSYSNASYSNASYSNASYTITALAGLNGSISPNGQVVLTSGSNQTFTITPNAGYQVSDVAVDDNSVGSVATYTFSNIVSNHTISAKFSLEGAVAGVSTKIDSQIKENQDQITEIKNQMQNTRALLEAAWGAGYSNDAVIKYDSNGNPIPVGSVSNQASAATAVQGLAQYIAKLVAQLTESNSGISNQNLVGTRQGTTLQNNFLSAFTSELASLATTGLANLLTVSSKWINYIWIASAVLIVLYGVYFFFRNFRIVPKNIQQ